MAEPSHKIILNAFQEIGKSINQKLNITGLNDTPSGYLGHSGDYLVVNDGESGIHFTGIEKIAADLTDYGFGGGSSDIPKYTNLPDPTENDGKIVASGCDLYYGCDGEWKKIGADSIPPPENVPDCVSNLEEYNQYQEYKNEFLAENSALTFDQMLNLNNDISESIYDVCLFSDSELSSVKIDETTYKWGMFANIQTVNITATPGVAITFSHWAGDGAVFGDANSSQTTLLVDKDLSVTGYFSEILEFTCNDIALHIQSDTTDASTTFTDQSSNTHTITAVGDTQHSTTAAHLGTTSMSFDGAGDSLKIDQSTNLNLTEDFTVECWFNTSNINHVQGGVASTIFAYSYDDFSTGNNDRTDLRVTSHGVVQTNSVTGDVKVGEKIKRLNITWSNNQWTHIAWVRSGVINTVYVNGSESLSWTETVPNFTVSGNLFIGSTSELNGNFIGHIQDFRVSKKVVYTSDFTPPNSLLNNPC